MRARHCSSRAIRARNASTAMHDPAERNPCAVVVVGSRGIVLVIRLVFVIRRFAPEHAGRAGKADECQNAENDCGGEAVCSGQRQAERHHGQPQHGVADHAAEAARQRPMCAFRETRCERGAENRAEQPQHHAQLFAAELAVAEQAVAPDSDRQQQGQRAQAEQLHCQVGRNRAGTSEQIVHRRVRRVAQRRVAHRPGGECQRRHHGEADHADTADLAQPPPHDGAKLDGQVGHPIKAAIDHRHRGCPNPSLRGAERRSNPGIASATGLLRFARNDDRIFSCGIAIQPSTPTRRCSASAVVSLLWTMATRT